MFALREIKSCHRWRVPFDGLRVSGFQQTTLSAGNQKEREMRHPLIKLFERCSHPDDDGCQSFLSVHFFFWYVTNKFDTSMRWTKNLNYFWLLGWLCLLTWEQCQYPTSSGHGTSSRTISDWVNFPCNFSLRFLSHFYTVEVRTAKGELALTDPIENDQDMYFLVLCKMELLQPEPGSVQNHRKDMPATAAPEIQSLTTPGFLLCFRHERARSIFVITTRLILVLLPSWKGAIACQILSTPSSNPIPSHRVASELKTCPGGRNR